MDDSRFLLIEDDKLFKMIEKYLKNASKEIRYIIIKPFEWKKESDFFQYNLQIAITQILHKLGVPSHIKGYLYMKEGICLIYQREETQNILKNIYPLIAEKYHSSISKVERAIRHAIEISWNRGDWDLMEKLFGNSIDGEKAKPTNREYMITIAEKLKLDIFHK